VPPGEAASVPAPAPAAATLWRRDAILLDLGSVQAVGRLVFEIGDAPWLERPRVEVSRDGVAWTAVDARASLADAALALTQDPSHALGAVRWPLSEGRYVRVEEALAARPGPLGWGR
jgi:hypothetical protein